MRNMLRRSLVIVLVLALTVTSFVASGPDVSAAKKPKLNKKTVSVKVGGTYKLKVKNANKKAKTTWKLTKKSKSIVKLSKKVKKGKKASVVITGLKEGKATIKAVYKLKGKKKTLKCKVTVTPADGAAPAGAATTAPASTGTAKPSATTAAPDKSAAPTSDAKPTEEAKATATPKPSRTPRVTAEPTVPPTATPVPTATPTAAPNTVVLDNSNKDLVSLPSEAKIEGYSVVYTSTGAGRDLKFSLPEDEIQKCYTKVTISYKIESGDFGFKYHTYGKPTADQRNDYVWEDNSSYHFDSSATTKVITFIDSSLPVDHIVLYDWFSSGTIRVHSVIFSDPLYPNGPEGPTPTPTVAPTATPTPNPNATPTPVPADVYVADLSQWVTEYGSPSVTINNGVAEVSLSGMSGVNFTDCPDASYKYVEFTYKKTGGDINVYPDAIVGSQSAGTENKISDVSDYTTIVLTPQRTSDNNVVKAFNFGSSTTLYIQSIKFYKNDPTAPATPTATPAPATATPTVAPATATPTVAPATATPTVAPATAEPTEIPSADVTAGFTSSAITVDGIAETAWDAVTAKALNYYGNSQGTTSATAKVLWDSGKFYVLVDVTDPSIDYSNTNAWEEDGMELFFDEDNSKETSYDSNADAFQYRFTGLDGTSTLAMTDEFASSGSLARTRYAAIERAYQITSTGYTVEMAVPFYSASYDGKKVGFEITVMDCTAGTRNNEIWLNGPNKGSMHQNPGLFGEAVLSGSGIAAPTPSPTPTPKPTAAPNTYMVDFTDNTVVSSSVASIDSDGNLIITGTGAGNDTFIILPDEEVEKRYQKVTIGYQILSGEFGFKYHKYGNPTADAQNDFVFQTTSDFHFSAGETSREITFIDSALPVDMVVLFDWYSSGSIKIDSIVFSDPAVVPTATPTAAPTAEPTQAPNFSLTDSFEDGERYLLLFNNVEVNKDVNLYYQNVGTLYALNDTTSATALTFTDEISTDRSSLTADLESILNAVWLCEYYNGSDTQFTLKNIKTGKYLNNNSGDLTFTDTITTGSIWTYTARTGENYSYNAILSVADTTKFVRISNGSAVFKFGSTTSNTDGRNANAYLYKFRSDLFDIPTDPSDEGWVPGWY